MAVEALFEHEDGYKYNEVFYKPKSFLRAIAHRQTDKLIHAIDYEKHFIIYPSTLPEYRAMYT